MKILEVNKVRYRNHVKKVIVACIVFLAVGSLGLSQALIALFPAEQGSHFHWNLIGVAITACSLLWLLIKVRHHDFMLEVTYVWDLKQALNQVIRKMRRLKLACEDGDEQAMQAMQFYFEGSRQLAYLDDNDLGLEALSEEQSTLELQAREAGVVLDEKLYDPSYLKGV